MKDNFKLKGDWFLPSSPKEKLKGVLKYDSKDGASLDLFGSFSKQGIDVPIILGESNDGKEITLYKSFLRHGWSHYTVNYILIGHHFEKAEDLKFDEIVSEIFNLDEWVCISGFTKPGLTEEEFRNSDIALRYKQPPPEHFRISDTLSGKFNFVGVLPSWSTTYMKDVKVAQRVQLVLNSTEELLFKDTLEHLFTFVNFITLAIYEATYPDKIILKSKQLNNNNNNDDDEGSQQKKIILHFAIRSRKENIEEKAWIEMLYWYESIRDKFPAVISKWYEQRKKLESTYNLLFEQFYHDGAYTENSFLNLAQAAESFHARLNKKATKISPKDYKDMKDDILKCAPEKYHPWLSEQFKFGNNVNLHTRLSELIDKYGNDLISAALGDKEDFIKKVKNSRNYYTHYSSNLEKKALKDVPLFWLGQKLKMIIVAAYLKEAGFDPTFVDKTMTTNKNYFVPFFMI